MSGPYGTIDTFYFCDETAGVVFLRSLLRPVLFQLVFWKTAALDPRRPSVRAAGWMVLASTLFATMNMTARVASREADFSQIAGARAFGGAGVALAFGLFRGSVLRVKHRGPMVWRSLFGTAAMLATFVVLADRSIPLGDAATLFNLSPLGVALLSPLVLGERPGKSLWLGLSLSLVGVIVIFRPSFLFGHAHASDTAGAATTAALLAMLAAFFSACAMMAVRKLGKNEAPEAIALHFAIFAGIVFLTIAVFRWRPVGLLTSIMMALGSISGGVAQIAMTEAYRIERAARVSSLGYLNVVVTAMLGMAFLHERPDHWALAGMGLVLAAGIFLATGAVGFGEAKTSAAAAKDESASAASKKA